MRMDRVTSPDVLPRQALRSRPLRRSAALSALILASILSAASPARASGPAGTYSIAAFDPGTGEAGVAVQSCVFGVGPRVAWVRGGVGAVATQAQSNESFGPDGLRLMASGLSAGETLDSLLAGDPERDARQVGIVDVRGGVAAWTGPNCNAWAGDSSGVYFTCQGNILAGEDVVRDMVTAFLDTGGEDLARRMLAALDAAQAAGGDTRGQQSAAILIGRAHPQFPEYAERYVDIRVDDHPEPLAELRRQYEMYESWGLLQARLRFADLYDAGGDSLAARRERQFAGDLMLRALEDDLQDPEMLNALAWFSAVSNLYLPQALEAATRAVALAPENWHILDTLAEIHYRMGDARKAIEVQTRALELAPDDTYLLEQLERFRSGLE